MARRALAALSILAAAVTLPTATATSARAETAPIRYVALGDSYTAGPLTSLFQPGSPLGCLRGIGNYPSIVARTLRPASFKDVSCSGAKTKHFTEAQSFSIGRPNPPQYDALSTETTLVSLTIGGNDIGFSKAVRCFELSYSDPEGSPCKDELTAGGVDQFAQSIAAAAPKVGTALAGIAQRAPNAKVFLLNYPLILPAEGNGCFPWVPIAKGDVPYLRDVQKWLNGMLADQAAQHGVTLVDTAEPGHDACQPNPLKRWVEGIPTQFAAPAHPNMWGEAAMASLLLEAVRAAG
ncbi:SGNH/GDSL hydrolase family protein [Thermomonospora umbrina]|uniref:GDSL-like lipase/acylhydrolase family protein n=1 Tax=Thermomonospora umbrina TaxID=111806 RepID=A0A3D9SX31_9ACTN|nr:SGNH/GDSL hydrolase family protein [Thermomonospora umbrina]REE97124.1 GDSL-like lipase/acylhydrolase family protein [Thermomonospora umbrina]